MICMSDQFVFWLAQQNSSNVSQNEIAKKMFDMTSLKNNELIAVLYFGDALMSTFALEILKARFAEDLNELEFANQNREADHETHRH